MGGRSEPPRSFSKESNGDLMRTGSQSLEVPSFRPTSPKAKKGLSSQSLEHSNPRDPPRERTISAESTKQVTTDSTKPGGTTFEAKQSVRFRNEGKNDAEAEDSTVLMRATTSQKE